MDNLSQLISVPIITAICYGVIEIYKYATNSNEKCLRFIPLISAVLGIALGVVAFYCAKGIVAADNILTAMLIGLSSGLAATGTNQIFKQLTKSNTTQSESKTQNEQNQGQAGQNTQNQEGAQEQAKDQSKEN